MNTQRTLGETINKVANKQLGQAENEREIEREGLDWTTTTMVGKKPHIIHCNKMARKWRPEQKKNLKQQSKCNSKTTINIVILRPASSLGKKSILCAIVCVWLLSIHYSVGTISFLRQLIMLYRFALFSTYTHTHALQFQFSRSVRPDCCLT